MCVSASSSPRALHRNAGSFGTTLCCPTCAYNMLLPPQKTCASGKPSCMLQGLLHAAGPPAAASHPRRCPPAGRCLGAPGHQRWAGAVEPMAAVSAVPVPGPEWGAPTPTLTGGPQHDVRGHLVGGAAVRPAVRLLQHLEVAEVHRVGGRVAYEGCREALRRTGGSNQPTPNCRR